MLIKIEVSDTLPTGPLAGARTKRRKFEHRVDLASSPDEARLQMVTAHELAREFLHEAVKSLREQSS